MAQTRNITAQFGATILIVDGDESVRSLLRDILEEQTFRVLEARSVHDFVEAAGQEPVDLAIVDLVNPDGSSAEALAFLRTSRPESRVLVISGAFSGSYAACARRLGVDAVVKMPFACECLVQSVRSLLAR